MARRASLSPGAVGLPGGTRRRTPGLRREELAALAGIGVTWYTWLEQGRDVQVSARTVERIAGALRLTPSDTEYLFALCNVQRDERTTPGAEPVDPNVLEVINAIPAMPAFFGDVRGDVLRYNRAADVVFDFEGYDGPYARNHHWRFFMDPKRRARYLEWNKLAALYVPWLRLAHGKLSQDPYFDGMIQTLCDESREFRDLWDTHVTSPLFQSIQFAMNLPRLGRVSFNSVRLHVMQAQYLFVVLTPADERTTRVLGKFAAAAPAPRRRRKPAQR